MNRHSQHLQLGGDAREHLDGGREVRSIHDPRERGFS